MIIGYLDPWGISSAKVFGTVDNVWEEPRQVPPSWYG